MKILKQVIMIVAIATIVFSNQSKAKEKHSHNHDEVVPLSWKTEKVADGLYMLSGVGGFTGGNLGLSIGDDGVILIDDAMPSTLDIMNKAIAKITTKPIDFLINTHVHGDHTGNNEFFGNKHVHIVAHENMRKHMLKKGLQTAEGKKEMPRNALPVITFSESMDFHLNGKDAHVFHLAHAHTDGDIAIYFKNVNVMHMGDTFFNKIFPFIDYNSGGSLDGYIAAQKSIAKIVDDKTRIIPGHGVLANKQDLLNSIAMLEEAKTTMQELIKQGKTEEQAMQLDPLAKKYSKWSWGFIDSKKMAQQIYKGLMQQAKN